MYRGALGSILSELIRSERMVVVKDFVVEDGKTKQLVSKLKALGLKHATIVTAEADTNLYLAARNLYRVEVYEVAEIDPVSLVGSAAVVITEAAIKQLEEKLS
jgi:large subunit ribosomal protein L4